MEALRHMLSDHRRFCVLLAVLALAIKAVVPAGTMVDAVSGQFTVKICTGFNGLDNVQQLEIPLNGKSGTGDGGQRKTDSACPYAMLAMASLAGAGPDLILAALAFVLALGFARGNAPPFKNNRPLRFAIRGPPFSVA